MKTIARETGSATEVRILARVLANEGGRLPMNLARYLLSLGFSDEDKARMHDLAVRNQDDALAPGEKDELYAYAKAGSLLSILKSKARRTLKVKPKRHNNS